MTSYAPTTRLDRLVTDAAERTYLDSYEGYWADQVLEVFSFLESRGGVLDRVRFHQNGHYVRYRGGWGTVTAELTPDMLSMAVSVQSDRLDVRGDLETVSRTRATDLQAPPLMGPDRKAIAAVVSYWATMLKGVVFASGESAPASQT